MDEPPSGLRELDLDQLSLFQNYGNEKLAATAEHYKKHVLIVITGVHSCKDYCCHDKI